MYLTKNLLRFGSILAFASQTVFGKADESAVISLDRDGFEKLVSQNKNGMIAFYRPEDKTYQDWAEKYERAAHTLRSEGIPLGSVNCNENEELCNLLSVKEKSVINVIGDGLSLEMYTGLKESQSIIEYMMGRNAPSMVDIRSIDDVANLVSYFKKPVVVVVGPENIKESLLLAIPSLQSSFTFAYLPLDENNKEVAIKLFRIADAPVTFHGDIERLIANPDNLMQWLTTENLPLLSEFSVKNAEVYQNIRVPLAAYLYTEKSDLDTMEPSLLEMAQKYRGNLVFVTFEASEIPANHLNHMGIKPQFPCFCIIDSQTETTFVSPQLPEEEFKNLKSPFVLTSNELTEFLQKFFNGEVEPSNKKVVHDEL